MYATTEEEFEEAVQAGIDSIPDEFLDSIDNVAFMIQDEPSPAQLSNMSRGTSSPGQRELLGLYSGIALTKRGEGYGMVPVKPDSITIFKGPHERICSSRDELFDLVRRTVVHEVGHHFGLDEDRLRAMGYGSS